MSRKNRKPRLIDRAIKIDATCPYCGYVTDRASNLTGRVRKPDNGDLSLCIKCGGTAKYHNLKLVVLSATERAALSPETKERLNMIRAAWRKTMLKEADVII